MMGQRTVLAVLVATLASGAVACSKQPRAQYASSSGQGTYALDYADSLSTSRAEIAAVESQVETAGGEFAKYPDALSNPSWSHVLVVYRAADEAGRTAAYGEELDRSEAVARFYVEEKDDLNRRVAGTAQHAAKEKQCDADVYGPTSYALGKGIEETLRDRLRERSEAHRYLDDYEDALGKKNRPKLEEQIDAISHVSYLAHVSLPRSKERLAQRVEEGSQVKSTLDRVAKDAHAIAEDSKASQPQRTRAAERERAATTAKARVDPEVAEAKKLADQMEKRADDARKKYQAAFDALTDAVEQRSKSK